MSSRRSLGFLCPTFQSLHLPPFSAHTVHAEWTELLSRVLRNQNKQEEGGARCLSPPWLSARKQVMSFPPPPNFLLPLLLSALGRLAAAARGSRLHLPYCSRHRKPVRFPPAAPSSPTNCAPDLVRSLTSALQTLHKRRPHTI